MEWLGCILALHEDLLSPDARPDFSNPQALLSGIYWLNRVAEAAPMIESEYRNVMLEALHPFPRLVGGCSSDHYGPASARDLRRDVEKYHRAGRTDLDLRGPVFRRWQTYMAREYIPKLESLFLPSEVVATLSAAIQDEP